MDAIKDQLYNPLTKLPFGGALGIKGSVPAGTYVGNYVNTDYRGWTIKSKVAAKQHSLNLYFLTAQVEDIGEWKKTLDSKPYNTTVDAELKDGKLIMLKVLPKSRKADIVLMQ